MSLDAFLGQGPQRLLRARPPVAHGDGHPEAVALAVEAALERARLRPRSAGAGASRRRWTRSSAARAGPRILAMRRANRGWSRGPKGSSMMSRSEKRFTRNGSTSSSVSGPPRLKRRTPGSAPRAASDRPREDGYGARAFSRRCRSKIMQTLRANSRPVAGQGEARPVHLREPVGHGPAAHLLDLAGEVASRTPPRSRSSTAGRSRWKLHMSCVITWRRRRSSSSRR